MTAEKPTSILSSVGHKIGNEEIWATLEPMNLEIGVEMFFYSPIAAAHVLRSPAARGAALMAHAED